MRCIFFLLPGFICNVVVLSFAIAGKDNSTCMEHGTQIGRRTARPAASLLQKVVRREARETLAVHAMDDVYQSPDVGCSGVEAQGKCWFLADFGETCSTACMKKGLNFSFTLADANDTIMAKLLQGHQPGGKQDSWGPLECLGRDERHYHTANAVAARDFIGDIGAWKYDSCRFACPCVEDSKCEWKQPPACAPEFVWKGVMYSGCPTIDHDGPWCMRQQSPTGNDGPLAVNWSACIYSCGSDGQAYKNDDGCTWEPVSSCVREFNYQGAHVIGCTDVDHYRPWCSGAEPYSGSWSHCQYTCPDTNASSKAISQDRALCTWLSKPECASSFFYKGKQYFGCTDRDHPTPWCSYDHIHKGMWSACTRICNGSALEKAMPTASTTTAMASTFTLGTTTVASVTSTVPAMTAAMMNVSDPCGKGPDTEKENDHVGMSCALDEMGYKIVAAQDSPVNMKRFVCRVADKLNCRVTDYDGLMKYAPNHSGLAKRASYQHLEDEMSILCHSGKSWLIPV